MAQIDFTGLVVEELAQDDGRHVLLGKGNYSCLEAREGLADIVYLIPVRGGTIIKMEALEVLQAIYERAFVVKDDKADIETRCRPS